MFCGGGGSSAMYNVSLVTIQGEIGRYINFSTAKVMMDEAFGVRNLKAVCLIIDSPGGSPVQSYLIAEYIRYKRYPCKPLLVSYFSLVCFIY